MTEPTIESIFHGRQISCQNGPSYDIKAWRRLEAMARTALVVPSNILEAARDLSEDALLPDTRRDIMEKNLDGFRLTTVFVPRERSPLALPITLWARERITHRVVAATDQSMALRITTLLSARDYTLFPLEVIANLEQGYGFAVSSDDRPRHARRISILTDARIDRLVTIFTQPFVWTSDLPLTE